ncbi:type IV secretion system DNA-binding domain-containing protein [Paracoccus sp. Ld10]|uniref:type IV secretion system DNA-binding domain-containing protein n=1 Tax=Paracoccus sp. Ld10 TaxID=649158 RepID=UPI00386E1E9C
MIEEGEAARDIKALEEKAVEMRRCVVKFVLYPSLALLGFGYAVGAIFSAFGGNMPGIAAASIGIGILGLLLTAVLMVLFRVRGHHGYDRQRIDGAKVLRLEEPMTSGEPLLPIGFARMPLAAEPVHTLIEGATGMGKTQVLKGMMEFIRARGDTVVVVDDNYDLHKAFGKSGDIVLSAFDEASPGWLPQNEVKAPADWSALAQSFIGDGHGEAAQWHQMAKALFAAVGRGYARITDEAGEPFDHTEFFHLLTQASAEDLAPFVKGTAAASLGVNDKALNNVRMTFFSTLKFWEYLRPGDFSLRDWVEQGGDRPSIFIPYTRRSLEESKNLISCWLDQIITTAVDLGENRENRVWVIIDELSGLGEISGLQTAVTLLRKTGFRVVCGIQNYEQIEKFYTSAGAKTITNNMVNKVILRATDPTTADRQSKLIGDARFRIFKASESASAGGKGVSLSMEEKVERLVLPSELSNLAPLNAFVIFSGDETTYRTPIPVYGLS